MCPHPPQPKSVPSGFKSRHAEPVPAIIEIPPQIIWALDTFTHCYLLFVFWGKFIQIVVKFDNVISCVLSSIRTFIITNQFTIFSSNHPLQRQSQWFPLSHLLYENSCKHPPYISRGEQQILHSSYRLQLRSEQDPVNRFANRAK